MAKTAQDIQDEIFRKMSAEERLDVGIGLWRLAKDLTGNKINYIRLKNAFPEYWPENNKN